MKVYLHYETGAVGPPFTMVRVLLPTDTIHDIIDEFTQIYNRTLNITGMKSSCLEIKDQSGDNLKPLSSLLVQLVNDKDDLFLVDCKERPAPSTVDSTNVSATSTKKLSAAVGVPSLKNSSNTEPSREIAELRKTIKMYYSKKMYRKARIFFEESKSKEAERDTEVLWTLASIQIENENFDPAIEYAERCAKVATKGGQKVSSATLAKYHYILAKAYFGSKQYEDADLALEKVFDSLGSAEVASRGPNAQLLFDSIALRAECNYEVGRHPDAANLVNSCMSYPKAESHPGLLLAYASFALRYGKYVEASTALIRAISVDPKNKRARKLLSEVMQAEEGLEVVVNFMPNSESLPSTLAFFATIAKDHSAIRATVLLLTRSLQLRTNSASFALNLAHAYELTLEYDAALRTIEGFCRKNSTQRVGSHGFTCQELLDALTDDIDGCAPTECVRWNKHGDNNRGFSQVFAFPSVPSTTDSREDSMEVAIQDEEIMEVDSDVSLRSETYDDDGLDLLAIGMTAIKVSYAKGDLCRLARLFKVVEGARRRSLKPLHETTIRNEQAYYHCIAEVLSIRPEAFASSPMSPNSFTLAFSNPLQSPLFSEAAANPIYLCGDSHVLSPAWSIVHINGRPRLLVPKLVTGVKHWHLRPQSDFYPKANFLKAVESIPERSEVIFIIGEIDCREGILLAVEKDRYPSMKEGMKTTVGVFISVLRSIINGKKIKAYIQPVLPILPETRPLVVAYNEIYKEAILKLKGAVWLDFYTSLVSPPTGDGDYISPIESPNDTNSLAAWDLKDELKLDGTHIHPSYISLLQEHLQLAAN